MEEQLEEEKPFEFPLLGSDEEGGNDGYSVQGERKNCKQRNAPMGNKRSLQRYLLRIAYNGASYCGFAYQQSLPLLRTVEGALLKSLLKTLLISDVRCNMSRCGRTDKGVHALANYVSVDLSVGGAFKEDAVELAKVLNKTLPEDIRVLAAMPVNSSFDARRECVNRQYEYYFPKSATVDVQRMHEAAQLFVGEHDFRNFCKIDFSNFTGFV